MTTATYKANRLHLDKRNSLAFDGKHGYAVLWAGSNGELESALDECADSMVTVCFRTYSDDTAKQDIATYTRRLAKLSPRYTFGGFQKAVINGFVQANSYIGILNRVM